MMGSLARCHFSTLKVYNYAWFSARMLNIARFALSCGRSGRPGLFYLVLRTGWWPRWRNFWKILVFAIAIAMVQIALKSRFMFGSCTAHSSRVHALSPVPGWVGPSMATSQRGVLQMYLLNQADIYMFVLFSAKQNEQRRGRMRGVGLKKCMVIAAGP